MIWVRGGACLQSPGVGPLVTTPSTLCSMGSRPRAAATGTRGVVSGGADTQAELATAEELKNKYQGLDVKALREKCQDLHLDSRGRKQLLVGRIVTHLRKPPATDSAA